MTTATILPPARSVFINANGTPLVGGKIYTYIPNTTTPKTTWQDAGETTPNSNPIILDGDGSCLFYGSGQYTMSLYDINNNLIWTGLTQDYLALVSSTPFPSLTVTGNAIIGGTLIVGGIEFYPNGGFVNKFSNPAMTITQRGTTGTITSSPAYCFDGYIATALGANCIFSQGNTAIPNNSVSSSLQITGSNGNTGFILTKRLSGSDVASFSSQQITFQCVIDNMSGTSITPTLTINHPTSLDNWSSSITDIGPVNLQTVANGSTAVVSYTFTAFVQAYVGQEVIINLGALGNAESIRTTNWDIRVTPGIPSGLNNNPPPIEIRPYGIELINCQTRFNSTFGNGVTPAQNSTYVGALQAQPYGTSAGELYTYWQFPVQMASIPTITTYSPAAANANWYDKTGSSAVTVNVDPDSAINTTGVLIGSQTTSLTVGHRCYIHATASCEL